MSSGKEQWALGFLKYPNNPRNKDTNGNFKALHVSGLKQLNGILLNSNTFDFEDGDYFKYALSRMGRGIYFVDRNDWTHINDAEAFELRKKGTIKRVFYDPGEKEVVVVGRWNDPKHFDYFKDLTNIKQNILNFDHLMYAQIKEIGKEDFFKRFGKVGLVIGNFLGLLSGVYKNNIYSHTFLNILLGNQNRDSLIKILKEGPDTRYDGN